MRKPVEKFKLSVSSLRGRKSFSYLAIAKDLSRKGFDVVNFGIGQPDVDTPRPIVDEAKRALDTGFTKYTEAQGIAELRSAIAEYLENRLGARVKASEILVTPGALPAIFLVYLSYVEPGDEVVIIEPSYPPYTELAILLNAKPVYVPLLWRGPDEGFELDVEVLENSVTNKTKLIVVNNPHNPTGAVISPKHIEKLYEVAKNSGAIILTDEIYSELILSDVEFKSFISFDEWRDNVIYVNGFSKTFSMTGWRLGYVVAREDVISKLTNLAVNIWSCPTSFVQKAGVTALKSPEVWSYVEEVVGLFRQRRDYIVSKLREIRDIDVWPSQATFYVFPHIGKLLKKLGLDEEGFAEQLLYKKHVVVLPGTSFPDKAGSNFIRLSFAVDFNSIAKGIERIKQFVEEASNGKST